MVPRHRLRVLAAEEEARMMGDGVNYGDPDDSTKAPNRVVHIDRAKTDLERMARAAIAMGVSNEAEGQPNA